MTPAVAAIVFVSNKNVFLYLLPDLIMITDSSLKQEQAWMIMLVLILAKNSLSSEKGKQPLK